MDIPSTRKRGTEASRQPLLKLESNEPRFPIFSLRNKDLDAIDGYVYSGERTFNEHTYKFEFRVTRNTATSYPGTFARKAHRAILSIVSEQGFPLQQPISWTWRELFRRMRISYSGDKVTKLKQSLLAIRGLMIQSNDAIITATHGTLTTSKGDDNAVGIYKRLTFKSELMPDGTVADRNFVWLDDWYLENLNANYFLYLDYELWQILDGQSPIASRLYEIALSKFHTHSLLRINYPTLANLLPITPHRYFSQAKQKLQPHFDIAVKAGVFQEPEWIKKPGDTVAQLHLRPGPTLDKIKQSDFDSEEVIDNISVKELRTQRRTPAAKLVSTFYTDFVGKDRHPTKKELSQAQSYIDRFTAKRAQAIMPRVISLMKDNFKNAKRFASVDFYIDDALQELERQEAKKKQQRDNRIKHAKEQKELELRQAADAKRSIELNAAWDALSEGEREQIRQRVFAGNKVMQAKYRKNPDSSLVHEMFLGELEAQPTTPDKK